MTPLRCHHVVASVADPNAGPSHSVVGLGAGLARLGVEVTIDSVAGWREGNHRPPPSSGVRFVEHRQNLAGLGPLGALCISEDLRRALDRAAGQGDILHAHGLWLMATAYPAWAGSRAGSPVVLSPRGMLGVDALAFSKRRKALFWGLLQRRAAAGVAVIHATSEAEYEDVRAAGLRNAVAIIPNGIDVPDDQPSAPAAAQRTLLSLGRLHPKKGLDRLVRAWAQVEPAHPAWRLRLVGPSELGYGDTLRALAQDLGLERVSIEPALHGAAKDAAYREADVFVLATLHENFAMTVAESLAAGTPVISTKGAPWAGLAREGCGWWINHGEASLAQALAVAMATPPAALEAMGRRGRAWMARDFSWDRVAADMLDVYRWIAGQAPDPPASVRLS